MIWLAHMKGLDACPEPLMSVLESCFDFEEASDYEIVVCAAELDEPSEADFARKHSLAATAIRSPANSGRLAAVGPSAGTFRRGRSQPGAILDPLGPATHVR